MARIALIKLFSGLNMGVAQLSAELLRAGHEAHVFHFKKTYMRPKNETEGMIGGEDIVTSGGKDMVWLLTYPFTDAEFCVLRSEIAAFNPDAIGLSCLSGTIDENARVTQELRKEFDCPILWGGLAPTLESEKCIIHADLIAINEAEQTIIEIAERLDAKLPLTGIHGTWYRDKNGIQKNPNRPILDLNTIAQPCWDKNRHTFIDNSRTTHDFVPHNMRVEYPIMTQRGCPFSCSFCVESRIQELFGKKDSLRRRDPELVIEELLWVKANRPKIKKILFYDDVFTINKRWLEKFLPLYKAEINMPFWCYTYPTTHTPEILTLLKDHGCVSVGMGVQTGSERLLKEHYNRPTKLNRIIEACKEIEAAGLEGTFDLITRGPFDTEPDLRATFDLLLDIPSNMQCLGFGFMSLFPTFDLTRQAEKTGLISSSSFSYVPPLPTDTYDYYHDLFLLTRSDMPREDLIHLADHTRPTTNREELKPALNQYIFNAQKLDSFWGRDWIV
jgi:radical SAM superfamily enzyme YgiQ (UPF0313 family)